VHLSDGAGNEESNVPPFRWTTFDLADQLPDDWPRAIGTAASAAQFGKFPRTLILSREAQEVTSVYRGRLYAEQVHELLPWLNDLYRGDFLELAHQACGEKVMPAADPRYSLVLNVQRGPDMRFECHVDSNPLTGLLFCTDYQAGAGGELVFGRDPAAADVAAVDRDCSVLRPHLGHLIFFDGRNHPHYARPLASGSETRVVAVMNYYTESYPESTRPQGLNRHLFGAD
jgi:hypothetical protein